MTPPRRAGGRGDDLSAEAVLRLAVVLEAGARGDRIWTALAALGDPVATRVIAGGAPDPVGVFRRWGPNGEAVAAVWHVAVEVGAPLGASLRAIAAALRDGVETAREVSVALAAPASTVRLMAWMPLVAVALGLVAGLDTIEVLFGTPIGLGCLVSGTALMLLGRWWSTRLVRAARAPAGIPGIRAEVLAVALSGGTSVDRARALVDRVLPERSLGDAVRSPAVRARGDPAGANVVRAAELTDEDAILALSREAGIPAAELLRSAAALARARARADGRHSAVRLGGRLLLPLGICTLPAFGLLAVAPTIIALMGSARLAL